MAFSIQDELAVLPDKPGVYIMRDANGKVIYVGKAVNLKSRVRSYFQSKHLDTKTILLVQNIASFETIIVANEVEALVLESNLIKRHQPFYNILLKDDHHYPYLRLSIQDPYPRLTVVRRIVKDGARYFGPYPGRTVYPTLEALKAMFSLRSCNRQLPATTPQRACLDYHIKKCSGPCIGAISEDDYRKDIRPMILFLEGRREELIRTWQQEMDHAADNLDFERAAIIRDQIKAMQVFQGKQRMEYEDGEDRDVIALAREADETQIAVLFYREGKIVGKGNYTLTGVSDQSRSEILTSFVKQFYLNTESLPAEIILQDALLLEEVDTIKNWLNDLKQKKIEIIVPQRGEKLDLVELAAKNALQVLVNNQQKRANSREEAAQALAELADHLSLREAPWRIECYDISNTQGNYSVASMVVFEHGIPTRKEYRRFRIKHVEGPNDFASMQEVISRRFSRARAEWQDLSEGKMLQSQLKFGILPTLVVIDGGKGQLSSARKVMKELGYENIATIGLAKQHELVFQEGKREPITLDHRSKSLRLLQRLRDEAHRFAITYHRGLRGDAALTSELEQIPGIGKTRVRLLLKEYAGIEKLALASLRELADLPGMNVKAAEAVVEYLRNRMAKENYDNEEDATPTLLRIAEEIENDKPQL